MEEKLAQLKTRLEADWRLLDRLLAQETPEEVQEVLHGQGLAFSLEEIYWLRDAAARVVQKGSNLELSDEDLEEIAGGVNPADYFQLMSSFIGNLPGSHNLASTTTTRW